METRQSVTKADTGRRFRVAGGEAVLECQFTADEVLDTGDGSIVGIGGSQIPYSSGQTATFETPLALLFAFVPVSLVGYNTSYNTADILRYVTHYVRNLP